jgi:hypothetical protein
MKGRETIKRSGDNLFKTAWIHAGNALDCIDNPEYFSVGGLSAEEKSDVVELLYCVLEFAQEHGIIDGYNDAKMREVCREA